MNKSRVLFLTVLALFLFSSHNLQLSQASTFHLSTTAQLQALLQQQYLLEQSVNVIVGDLTLIDSQVRAAPTSAQKASILQKAIAS